MDFASYVSGFIDGEGCFSVSFNLRTKLKTGIEIRPSFSVAQNKRSRLVLEKLHDFFKCGAIRFSKIDQCYKYEIRSVTDLVKKVIPHFRKYPLLTAKKQDFELFAEICDAISQSKHLNPDHLRDILEKAYRMNVSGKRKYEKAKLLTVLDKMKI